MQERLLGATLGSVLMGGVILEQRRGIHRSLSDSQYNTASKSQHFVVSIFTANSINYWFGDLGHGISILFII